ncbi:MAG: RNA-binding domain-containing protein [Fervidicoccaceae archaeon]
MKRVLSIEISAIKHMTEDEAKVERCMLALLPPLERERAEIQKIRSRGHHGNEITLMRIQSLADPEHVAEYIFESIDDYSKNILLLTKSSRIEDEKRLHLRFSKHMLLKNKLVISDSDEVVKVVIRFSSVQSIDEFLNEKLKGR